MINLAALNANSTGLSVKVYAFHLEGVRQSDIERISEMIKERVLTVDWLSNNGEPIFKNDMILVGTDYGTKCFQKVLNRKPSVRKVFIG